MEIYNLEKLVKISVSEPVISTWYTYKKRKTFLGIEIVKEGIRSFGYVLANVPENHFIDDGKVYTKNKVTLHYEGRYEKNYYFETYKEALEFKDKIKSNKSKWKTDN